MRIADLLPVRDGDDGRSGQMSLDTELANNAFDRWRDHMAHDR